MLLISSRRSSMPRSSNRRFAIRTTSASTSGPAIAQRLDAELMELPRAPALRTLATEHRADDTTAAAGRRTAGCARWPRAPRRPCSRACSARCSRWPSLSALSSNAYISFSTMSVTSPMPAREQRRLLEDRRADAAIAIRRARRPAAASSKRSHNDASAGKRIVHALDGAQDLLARCRPGS